MASQIKRLSLFVECEGPVPFESVRRHFRAFYPDCKVKPIYRGGGSFTGTFTVKLSALGAIKALHCTTAFPGKVHLDCKQDINPQGRRCVVLWNDRLSSDFQALTTLEPVARLRHRIYECHSYPRRKFVIFIFTNEIDAGLCYHAFLESGLRADLE